MDSSNTQQASYSRIKADSDSEGELELTLSPDFPRSLLQALPFVLVSDESHLVRHSVLRNSDSSTEPTLTKRYYVPHIEDIKKKFEDVRDLGAATAEEWTKGLAQYGQNRVEDTIRWEQWEAKGGLQRVNARPQRALASLGTVRKDTSQVDSSYQRGFLASNQSNGEARLLDRSAGKNVSVDGITVPLAVSEESDPTEQHMTEQSSAVDTPLNVLQQQSQRFKPLTVTTDSSGADSDALKRSLKSRLDYFADEIIKTRWSGGRSVSKETCSKFAADVLVQVRQHIQLETQKQVKSLPASKVVCLNSSPSYQSDFHKLTLEDMKWVFDNKIRPWTDRFQKELFLCNGCTSHRYYGFESVIQHFAAKHTTELSMGNVVVHWRADWPEIPPFNPNPSVISGNATSYCMSDLDFTNSHNAPPNKHVNTKVTNSNTTKELGVPSVLHSIQGQNLADCRTGETQNISLMSARTAQTADHIEDGRRDALQRTRTVAYIHHDGIAIQPIESKGPQPPTAESEVRAHPFHSNTTPPNPTRFLYQHGISPPGSTGISIHSGHHPSGVLPALDVHQVPCFESGVQPATTDLYKRQGEEMARHAKDIFTILGSVKDIPGSVRIFVTIQHTVSRFKAVFTNDPSLSMFIDGLDRNATMRPVRSVNGLACRACVLLGNPTGFAHASHGVVVENRRLYTLPHLVNHFRAAHTGISRNTTYSNPRALRVFDWKQEMIELPELSSITRLASSSGMTDSTLNLIASVIPNAFSFPLPAKSVSTVGNPEFQGPLVTGVGDSDVPQAIGDRPANSTINSRDSKRERPFLPKSNECDSSARKGVFELSGDGEYDPRRPANLDRIIKIGRRGSSLDQGHKAPFTAPKPDGPRLIEPKSSLLISMHSSNRTSNLNRPTTDVGYFSSASPDITQGRSLTSQTGHVEKFDKPNSLTSEVFNKNERPDRLEERNRHAIDRPKEEQPADSLEYTSRDLYDYEQRVPLNHLSSRDIRSSGPDITRDHRFTNGEERLPFHNATDRLPEQWVSSQPFHVQGQDTSHSQRGRKIYVEGDDYGMLVPIDESPNPPPRIITSSSRGRIPLLSGRTYSPISYAESDQHGALILRRNSQDDLTPSQGARLGRGRARSRSPSNERAQNRLYRRRSPIEEDRGSTTLLVRRCPSDGSQRLYRYEHPADESRERIHRIHLEEALPNRVEYVPIRTEEPLYREIQPGRLRYVVAQPEEHDRQLQYLRYAPSHSTEPMYNTEGSWAPTEQVPFVRARGHPGHPTSSSYGRS